LAESEETTTVVSYTGTMTVLVEVVGGEDVLRDGQQSCRSSAQPMMGASRIPPPLNTSAVYIGIMHVPTSSDWPVNGAVGKALCVEAAAEIPPEPAAFGLEPCAATVGTITVEKLNNLD
jgi:hypothetical protein